MDANHTRKNWHHSNQSENGKYTFHAALSTVRFLHLVFCVCNWRCCCCCCQCSSNEPNQRLLHSSAAALYYYVALRAAATASSDDSAGGSTLHDDSFPSPRRFTSPTFRKSSNEGLFQRFSTFGLGPLGWLHSTRDRYGGMGAATGLTVVGTALFLFWSVLTRRDAVRWT